MIVAIRIALASAGAFVVFVIAQAPLLVYVHRPLSEFEPGMNPLAIAAQSVVLAALYFFAAPRRWPLRKGGLFGALTGLLVSLPDQLLNQEAASLLQDRSLRMLFLAIEAWHVAAWGAAGLVIAWVARLGKRWSAA